MVGTWWGDCCRQVEAEEVSNSRKKIHQTTYKDFFWALYTIKCISASPMNRSKCHKLFSSLHWRWYRLHATPDPIRHIVQMTRNPLLAIAHESTSSSCVMTRRAPRRSPKIPPTKISIFSASRVSQRSLSLWVGAEFDPRLRALKMSPLQKYFGDREKRNALLGYGACMPLFGYFDLPPREWPRIRGKNPS